MSIDDEPGRCLRDTAEAPQGGLDPLVSRSEVKHEVAPSPGTSASRRYPRPPRAPSPLVNSQWVGAVVDQAIAGKGRLGIEPVWLQPTCAAPKLLFGPARIAGG
jgi:hypothetical protein